MWRNNTIFILLSLIVIYFLSACGETNVSIPEEKKAVIEKVQIDTVVERVYGFKKDDYSVLENVIAPNQPLSLILQEYGVSFQKINLLAHVSKEIFDLRKLKAGNKYTLLFDQKKEQPSYFIYEENPIDYVVFSLKDSVGAYRNQKPVETFIRESSGIIENSLYVSMTEQGDSPVLIDRLTDIFAWQIDFFTIQKGDKYKVVYEEQIVEGETVGVGKVLGAWFEHKGDSNYAIYFKKDSIEGYYDQGGNSMRKAFLKAPLKYSRISSRYTLKRFHPVQKRWKAHLGTDYAAPTGTPIMSVGDGTVLEATYSKFNGRYVKIKHNATYSTQYLHMSKIAPGVKPGVRIKQGQLIGYVGSTGLATGPHLCFRFWKNGHQVDPFSIKMPPSKKLTELQLEAFYPTRDEIVSRLNLIEIVSEIPVVSATE